MSMLFRLCAESRFRFHMLPTLAVLCATYLPAQTGTVTGQVFCADTQKPARFAAVLIFKAGGRAYSQIDGTFVLKDVPAGNQKFQILYPGYIAAGDWDSLRKDADPDTLRDLNDIDSQAQVTVLPGRSTNVTVTIIRGAELGGVVTYEDGSPAVNFEANATYVITPAQGTSPGTTSHGAMGPSHSARTDSHGRFQITGLIGGSYIIGARGSERYAPFSTYYGNTVEASKAVPVAIKSGEVRSDLDLQIALNDLRQVRGFVMTADHQPVARAGVQLTFADNANNEEVRHTTTAADGSFIFFTVPDGNFVLQGGDSRTRLSATPIAVSGHDVTDLILTTNSQR